MAIRCGNRSVHGSEPVYHESVQAVRECFVASQVPDILRGQRKGYFALHGEGDKIHFYRVDRREDGFAVYAQAGPAYEPVASVVRTTVLRRVARDVDGASRLYAEQLGRCFVCGLELTDTISREMGIGPVCRSRIGA